MIFALPKENVMWVYLETFGVKILHNVLYQKLLQSVDF